jgi:hypothetical protein
MSETDIQDPDLVTRLTDRLAREVGAGAALFGNRGANPSANLELTIGTLAKELSKLAAGSVEDRHSRQLARTNTYNAVRPVLEILAHHHRRGLRRAHAFATAFAIAFAIAAGVVVIVAFLGFRLS